MKILFIKSKWEMWNDPLEIFLQRAVSDGFDAVEIYTPSLSEKPKIIRDAITNHNIHLVAQIITEGSTPNEHLSSLEKRFALAKETNPLLINSHTGSDAFLFEDNVKIIQRANELAKDADIRITHETHRSRPFFNIPDTCRYLKELPETWLNADISHWTCVHESLLDRFSENLEFIFPRCAHIHARVGFEQGPQVPDPMALEYQTATNRFVEWWTQILKLRAETGDPYLTITPEFGPPPYMPCEPHTQRPLEDAWTVNVRFKNYLEDTLPFTSTD